MSAPESLLDVALELHAAGLCVLPAAEDQSKRPAVDWKAYQQDRPDEAQLHTWFGDGRRHGLGLVCGAVSGGLEVTELEARAVQAGAFVELSELAANSGLADLWHRTLNGWLVSSPSGGLHLLYRLAGAPVGGNTKLAATPDHVTLAETRGEGGWIIAAPSGGPVHPSGGSWTTVAGGPSTMATLTPDEREALHVLVRQLDQRPAPPPPSPFTAQSSGSGSGDEGISPGDDYTARTTWPELLEPAGWRQAFTRGQVTYWRRPGKRDGISATTGYQGDWLYVFSSSTEFEPLRTFTRFGAYTVLHHGGDYKAAARKLSADGYGHRPRATATAPPSPPPAAVEGAPDRAPLDALLQHLRTWQVGGDLAHVVFALAVAVSATDPAGEPLWGMIVGPSSSGKTEAVRTLDDVTDDHVDELTAAALLSWSKTKTPRPTGVLMRVPNPALLTVGDFSTVLATSDHGGRDQLFALLRRVYDGTVTRDLGNAPEALRWAGRLTILAAVTPAIDDYSSHSDALGPRWLYLRMSDPPRAARRAAAGRRAGDLTEKRTTARRLATDAVRLARGRLAAVNLTDDTLATLGDAAIVVAAARGAVPRDGYGRRDIIGTPTIEEPHRLVGQLQMLARCLLALGLDVDEAEHLVVRAALDAIPRARRDVLRVLATGQVCTVSNLATGAGLNRRVARFAVEDLREVLLTCCPVEDLADVDDLATLGTVRRDWQLTDDLGQLAAEVLSAQAARAAALDTKKGDHPPIPPITASWEGATASEHRDTTPLSCQAEATPDEDRSQALQLVGR